MNQSTKTEAEIAPTWQDALSRFLDFVVLERGLAANTADGYGRDLARLPRAVDWRGTCGRDGF